MTWPERTPRALAVVQLPPNLMALSWESVHESRTVERTKVMCTPNWR